MKSIRHTILAALAKEPMIMDGLIDATGIDKHRIQDNMQAAIKEGLVDRSKDAVTGMLLYTITAAGRQRQKDGPQSKGGEAMQAAKKDRVKVVADLERKPEKIALAPAKKKPMSRVDIIARNGNDGDHYAEIPPADAALLASANRMLSERLAGVAHALRGSGLPALADIDDGEDMQMCVAALTGAYQMALAERDNCLWQRDAWRNMAAAFDCSTPNELVGYIETLQRESMKGVTCISRPKERVFQGFACMVGGAEIYQDETAARMAAETALADFPAGQSVAVVAIVAQAENVLAPLWKEAA